MISGISLRNFRSFVELSLQLGQITVFAGENEAGKSTILDAISVAGSGTCRGADNGRALGELRTTGSKRKWEVLLNIPADDGKGFVIGRTEGEGPRSNAQQAIFDALGVTGEQWRACLYSFELLRLMREDRAGAQALILDLAKPQAIRLPADVLELLNNRVRQGFQDGDYSLPLLDELYQKAFKLRTEAGRALKEMGAPPAEPAAPDDWPELAGQSPEQLQAGSRKLGEAIVAVREAARGKRNELDRAVTAPSNLEFKLKRVREALEAGKDSPAVDAATIAAQTTAAAGELAQLERAKADARAKIDQEKNAIGQLTGEMELNDRFLAHDQDAKACRFCETTLTAAKVEKIRTRLRDRSEAIQRDRQQHEMQLEAVQASAKDIDKKIRDVEGRLSTIEADERRYLNEREGLAELTKHEAELDQKLTIARAQADLAKTTLEGEIAQLEEKIERGMARVEALANYAAAVSRGASYAEVRAQAEAEHGDLDRLCDVLGPMGIRKDVATSGGIDEFLSFVTTRMEEFGYTGVDFGPLLRLEDDALVYGRPARLLADSAKMRFGLCFQLAVAQWTKLGIIAVDDFERFDPARQRQAISLIAQSGVQAFLFQVMRDREKFLESAARSRGKTTFVEVVIEKGVSRVVVHGAAAEAVA